MVKGRGLRYNAVSRKKALRIMKTAKSKPAPATSNTPTTPGVRGIRSILVPLDFSIASRKALNYAVGFAEQFDAKLTLLNVIEPIGTPDFQQTSPVMLDNEKLMERCRHELEHIAKQDHIRPELIERIDIRFGRSYNEITEAARALKADLIVISTHGYTGWKHTIFGSTTERVVRQAPCPVLVVREQEREFI